MHVFLSMDDPNLVVVATLVTPTPEDHFMSRKLFLLFFAAAVSVFSACTTVAGPNRDDPEWTAEDSAEFCSVVAGSQTCSWPDPDNR